MHAHARAGECDCDVSTNIGSTVLTQLARSLAHAYIHVCSHIHAHMYACTNAAEQPCRVSFIHSFIRSFIHPFIYSSIHSLTHPFIRSFIHPFIRSFICSFIHSFVHSFIRSFIHSFNSARFRSTEGRPLSVHCAKIQTRRPLAHAHAQECSVRNGKQPLEGIICVAPWYYVRTLGRGGTTGTGARPSPWCTATRTAAAWCPCRRQTSPCGCPRCVRYSVVALFVMMDCLASCVRKLVVRERALFYCCAAASRVN